MGGAFMRFLGIYEAGGANGTRKLVLLNMIGRIGQCDDVVRGEDERKNCREAGSDG